MGWTNCRQSDQRRRPRRNAQWSHLSLPGNLQASLHQRPRRSAGYRASKPFTKVRQAPLLRPVPPIAARQPLEWSGLRWGPGGTAVAYVCRECGALIYEHHKTAMIAAGRWVAEALAPKPAATTSTPSLPDRPRPPLRPGRNAARRPNDPARLKTFINDRLAEAWKTRPCAPSSTTSLPTAPKAACASPAWRPGRHRRRRHPGQPPRRPHHRLGPRPLRLDH